MAKDKINIYSLGGNVGRPRIYSSPEEMEEKVLSYFQHCNENKDNPKVTGLCLFLGFSCRETLNEYQKLPEFSDIIKRAKLGVESHYEEGLNTFKYGGSVFALKNMGWKDQQDQNITQTITTVAPQVVKSDIPLSGSEGEIKE
jgi:hypothetical protein